jgi:hypothetical protein
MLTRKDLVLNDFAGGTHVGRIKRSGYGGFEFDSDDNRRFRFA